MSFATSLSAQGNAVLTQSAARVSACESEAGPPAPQLMPTVSDPLAPPSVEVRCAALTANARSNARDAVLPKVRYGMLEFVVSVAFSVVPLQARLVPARMRVGGVSVKPSQAAGEAASGGLSL